MIAKLRFWGMTVGMTVLIWYAADQSVTASMHVAIALQVRPEVPESMLIETLDTPEVRSVRLQLQGPNRAIAELRAAQNELAVALEIDERASGTYAIDLLEHYRQYTASFPEGLAVVSVQPKTITIRVDRYVEQEVRLRIGEPASPIERAQLDPATVTAVVPEMLFSALPAEQRVITLDVAPWLAKAVPGELHRDTVVVPHNVSGIAALRVKPQSVALSGTVRQRVETLHIQTMPIGIKFSSIELTDYRVTFGDGDDQVVTVELWVRGPAEQILKIKEDPARHIEGFIRITRQDVLVALKPGETLAKVPHFLLPEGVDIEAREPEELHVRITPRD